LFKTFVRRLEHECQRFFVIINLNTMFIIFKTRVQVQINYILICIAINILKYKNLTFSNRSQIRRKRFLTFLNIWRKKREPILLKFNGKKKRNFGGKRLWPFLWLLTVAVVVSTCPPNSWSGTRTHVRWHENNDNANDW